MPATAPATIAPGNEIEFCKYPVVPLLVIMNALNQVSSPAGKWILFFKGDHLVKFFKTVSTKTVIECIGEKGFGSIAQCNL